MLLKRAKQYPGLSFSKTLGLNCVVLHVCLMRAQKQRQALILMLVQVLLEAYQVEIRSSALNSFQLNETDQMRNVNYRLGKIIH